MSFARVRDFDPITTKFVMTAMNATMIRAGAVVSIVASKQTIIRSAAVPKEYSPEITAAALRVARIFDQGCDRCDGDDLNLLEKAGLMEVGVCRDTFGQDTLEVGDPMWTFNAEGNALAKALLSAKSL